MKYDRAVYENQLAAFRSDIAELSLHDIRPLPDFTHYLDHQGREPRFPKIEPGFYINSKSYSYIANRSPDLRVEIMPDDAQKITREDSRHQVFLGYLDFVHDDSVQFEANVAVKATKAELKELSLYQYMGALGISSFKPFGFIRMKNGNQHLLTKVRSSVKTIDATEWSLLTPEEMWETARAGVDTMLMMNKNMLFHGDLEFRNVAIGDFAEPVVVDPEFTSSLLEVGNELLLHMDNAKFAQVPEISLCLDAIARKMGVDFTALTASTKASIFPALPYAERPRNDAAIFKKLKHHYYDRYKEGLLDLDTPYRQILLRAFDVLLAKRKVEVQKGII